MTAGKSIMNCMVNLILFLAFSWLRPDPPAPPGTERIGENLFMDKRPVAMQDYQEFLGYVQLNGFRDVALSDLLPDSTLISRYYIIKDADFDESPVYGLTGAQISLYCAWRGEVVSRFKNDRAARCGNAKYWKKFDRHDRRHRLKIVYRLPRLAEYPRDTRISSLSERAADGFFPAGAAQPVIYGFRCVAEFVPIE